MQELLLSVGGGTKQKFVFDFYTAKTRTISNYAQQSVFAASTVYQGRIFSFGGYTTANITWSYAYNPLNDTYEALPPTPTAMHGASAVVYKETILIFGGTRADGTTDIIVYTPETKVYTRKAVTGLPAMAYNQVAIAEDIVHIPPMSGGINHYLVNLVTNTVSTVAVPTGIVAAMDMSAIRVGNYVYCFGGRGSRSTGAASFKQAYRINLLDNKTMERLPDMPTGVLTGSQLYTSDKEIYILYGNSQNEVVGSTMIYIIAENRWVVLANPVGAQPRFGATTGYVNNRFYLIGGWQRATTTATTNIEYYMDNTRYYPASGPGSKYLYAGDTQLGYFGPVVSSDLLNYSAYTRHVIPSSGQASLKPDRGWLKFFYKGKVIYYSKTQIGVASWDILYANGGLYGTNDNGKYPIAGAPVNQYKPVTLVRENYVNKLIPRGVSFMDNDPTGVPVNGWGEFINLLTRVSSGVDSSATFKDLYGEWEKFHPNTLGLIPNTSITPLNSGRDFSIETFSGSTDKSLSYQNGFTIGTELKSFHGSGTQDAMNWRAVFELESSEAIGPDNSGPGPKTLKFGDEQLGYFGEVPSDTPGMTSYQGLMNHFSLGSPNVVNPVDSGWFKFAWKGAILFIAKSWVASNISWADVYGKGGVYGINGAGPYPPTGMSWGQRQLITTEANYKTYTLLPRMLRVAVGDPLNRSVIATSGDEFSDLLFRMLAKVRVGATDQPHAGEWGSFTASELGLDRRHWTLQTSQGAANQGAIVRNVADDTGQIGQTEILKTDRAALQQVWRPVLQVVPM